MRVISKRALVAFWGKNPQAKDPLMAWFDSISSREWKNINELRQCYHTIDYVGNNRFVFDILRDRFRLIAKIDFNCQLAFVRFVGTHKEYDRIADISSI